MQAKKSPKHPDFIKPTQLLVQVWSPRSSAGDEDVCSADVLWLWPWEWGEGRGWARGSQARVGLGCRLASP